MGNAAVVEPISLVDQITWMGNEIEVRERLHRQWVPQGSRTQVWCDREMARMRAVLATLEALRDWQRIEEHK